MAAVSVIVCGAGVIGQAHIRLLAGLAPAQGRLAGIVDPAPAAAAQAAALGVPYAATLEEALAGWRFDAVIIAAPNALHVPMARACIAHGKPMLVEKPLADDAQAAFALAREAEAAGVALLVGHFRRHNPVLRAAREIIAAGRLGRIVSINADVTVCKPEGYFNIAWRTQKGGGPVLINLVHDIDALRYLCGEIEAVQAFTANQARGFAVEDSAAVLLRFASGALATLTLSDATPSPWCWDQLAGENPSFPRHVGNCYRICGTEAALELPSLTVWDYPAGRGWAEKLAATIPAHETGDPLALQLGHFLQVARGEAAPLISGADGAATIAATMAVHEAAARGALVTPARDCQPG
ncbi:Gfo/Idh/MocA family protein [Acidocella sp.]|uniref:Gfo/Idh/MocA family protein n=1 Tax=Acidocella sp. TaxID=50710 RepID=UPI00261E5B49|nr:Gfo/Idh/MocA family oxidoreductase [Acidocella sp.]